MASRWTEEEKIKTLAIARASSATEASKQTGVPRGTVLTWMRINQDDQSINQDGQSVNHSKKATKKIEVIAQQAVEEAAMQAKETVAKIVTDRSVEIAQKIFSLVELAVEESERVLLAGPNENEPRAAWLKATIGAMHMGVDKTQLLTGKPTERQEIQGELKSVQEQHYHIIRELVNQDDEIADRFLNAFREQRSP